MDILNSDMPVLLSSRVNRDISEVDKDEKIIRGIKGFEAIKDQYDEVMMLYRSKMAEVSNMKLADTPTAKDTTNNQQ